VNRLCRTRVYTVTMKTNRVLLIAAVAVVSALAVSSCTYDPHYSNRGYSSGYGHGYGHGYGSSSFTTTYFVSTGNPRWGYDPYSRCYYDYHRRSYYDPYLYGYYPVGYRPIYVQGTPHPHRWRSGSRYIAPPSRIREQRLENYQNRGERYRSLNNDWSRNVQVTKQTRDDRYSRKNSTFHTGSSQPTSSPIRVNDGDRYFGSRSVSDSNFTRNDSRTAPRTFESRQEPSRSVHQQPPVQIKEFNRQKEAYSSQPRQEEVIQERGLRRAESVRPEPKAQSESRSPSRNSSNREAQMGNDSRRGSQEGDEPLVRRR